MIDLWGVAGILLVLVIIAVLLDPWLAPEEPSARERREWLAQAARALKGRDV